jgi:hypothetical protein
MEQKPSSSKSTLSRILAGLAVLILLVLSVAYYLDRSWSNSLKDKDIVTRSIRNPVTGVLKDTTYFLPHSPENLKQTSTLVESQNHDYQSKKDENSKFENRK